MSVYSPSLVSLVGALCPIQTGATTMSYPDAPRNYTVPLPGTPVGTALIELENISLTSPIHIHTPIAHVGLIYGMFPGQNLTTLNAVMFLKQFWAVSIDRNMFAQLSPEVKA
ncbi:hypothetical protein AN958_05128 [Leucoagaricus sp. SymC.cos]|nr:hypothetical protein AN958_05128 [Leucoagaricus sp. SymC.cos]